MKLLDPYAGLWAKVGGGGGWVGGGCSTVDVYSPLYGSFLEEEESPTLYFI